MNAGWAGRRLQAGPLDSQLRAHVVGAPPRRDKSQGPGLAGRRQAGSPIRPLLGVLLLQAPSGLEDPVPGRRSPGWCQPPARPPRARRVQNCENRSGELGHFLRSSSPPAHPHRVPAAVQTRTHLHVRTHVEPVAALHGQKHTCPSLTHLFPAPGQGRRVGN